ncbi:thylakoid membrane photosystem I accumulation factor [Trichothermofontia sp.]
MTHRRAEGNRPSSTHRWQWGQRTIARILSLSVLAIALTVLNVTLFQPNPALASLNDDRFDGNIFALYAGNGSLVPPRVTLQQSRQRPDRATVMMLYVEDSRDCKQYASVLSQLQAFYGRVADFIPINVDSLPAQPSRDPNQPGYYYKGAVPQTVVFDQAGQVVLNETGIVSFERVDDVLREVFDLLPRSQSVELKRRPVNELNTELVAD